MTNNQLNNAVKILSLLQEGNGVSDIGDILYHSDKNNLDRQDTYLAIEQLNDLKIAVYYGSENHLLRSTYDGDRAMKIGLEEFLMELEMKGKLEIKTMKATIKASKWNKWYTIMTITGMVVTIILTILIATGVIGK